MALENDVEWYPSIEPYKTGFLQVSDLHKIYYEESGNKEGNAVVFLHGGPGSGTKSDNRRFFDPEVYRIILLDQRGAGKSEPSGELRNNTTWDLVEDLERLRKHLDITKWVLFGGSWGSTLALAYAQLHPERVKALVMRGIFTCRRKEVLFTNQEGANFLFPDKFEEYAKYIPECERFDLLGAYYRRLTSSDPKIRLEAAKFFSTFEGSISRFKMDVSQNNAPDLNVNNARIECHYLVYGGFMQRDGQLLESENIDKIRHIPATIFHGRYDVVAPMETAWVLHKRWPEADFHIVPNAGHSFKDATLIARLVAAAEKYKHL